MLAVIAAKLPTSYTQFTIKPLPKRNCTDHPSSFHIDPNNSACQNSISSHAVPRICDPAVCLSVDMIFKN